MILATSDKIEGREIAETIGIVRGNAARARGLGYDITAGTWNVPVALITNGVSSSIIN